MLLNNFSEKNITWVYKDCTRHLVGNGNTTFIFNISRNNEDKIIKIHETHIKRWEEDYERAFIEIDFISEQTDGTFVENDCYEDCSQGPILNENGLTYIISSVSIE
jgi:hypothetical protein